MKNTPAVTENKAIRAQRVKHNRNRLWAGQLNNELRLAVKLVKSWESNDSGHKCRLVSPCHFFFSH